MPRQATGCRIEVESLVANEDDESVSMSASLDCLAGRAGVTALDADCFRT